jgi:hypothetical protein
LELTSDTFASHDVAGRSFHTDEREEAMRTNWPAYVAAEVNRIAADEEAFKRLADLFKQAHGRAPASDCEAYKWGAKMEDAALTSMGFEGRAGFQYNYDLCLMAEYGPRVTIDLNSTPREFRTHQRAS